MGQAGPRVYDKRLDKSLTTVADLESMTEQVQGWCDLVQRHVTDGLAHEATQRDAAIGKAVDAALKAAHEEVATLARTVDDYRKDELRYRQARTWRGRIRRWFGRVQP